MLQGSPPPLPALSPPPPPLLSPPPPFPVVFPPPPATTVILAPGAPGEPPIFTAPLVKIPALSTCHLLCLVC